MNSPIDLLQFQLAYAWKALLRQVEQITEEEYHWEPDESCWTVRARTDGRWDLDYALPEPDPAPLTTIGWRLLHVASCKMMYYHYAFGPGKLTWEELDYPGSLSTAIAWLKDQHVPLEAALAGLHDSDLSAARATNWGELWPTWHIFWTLIQHDLQHGAEIGCLRDLYRVRHS